MRVRKRLIRFVLIIQFVLFLSHLLVYETWTFSTGATGADKTLWIKLVAAALSVSFVAASLLGFRYSTEPVRIFYRVAAVWLGWLTLLVLACAAAWIVFGITRLASISLDFHRMVAWLFGAAIAAGGYAVLNANRVRTTYVSVQLPNLVAAWRGRRVALISDLHLGHVRNGGFLRRTVSQILHEQPDAVMMAGDLFDGTPIDLDRAAEPLRKLTAPHGVYFVAGNHEQFWGRHEISPRGRERWSSRSS